MTKIFITLIAVVCAVWVLVGGYPWVHSLSSGGNLHASTAAAADQPPPVVQPQGVDAQATATDQNGSGSLNNQKATVAKSKEAVWRDINDAIYGLNELVGADMFLNIERIQKGQLEVSLAKKYWDRVQYQTRVDLKNDISDLWHLYAKEYNHSENSVVYFIDHDTNKVIDIFSKAN